MTCGILRGSVYSLKCTREELQEISRLESVAPLAMCLLQSFSFLSCVSSYDPEDGIDVTDGCYDDIIDLHGTLFKRFQGKSNFRPEAIQNMMNTLVDASKGDELLCKPYSHTFHAENCSKKPFIYDDCLVFEAVAENDPACLSCMGSSLEYFQEDCFETCNGGEASEDECTSCYMFGAFVSAARCIFNTKTLAN